MEGTRCVCCWDPIDPHDLMELRCAAPKCDKPSTYNVHAACERRFMKKCETLFDKELATYNFHDGEELIKLYPGQPCCLITHVKHGLQLKQLARVLRPVATGQGSQGSGSDAAASIDFGDVLQSCLYLEAMLLFHPQVVSALKKQKQLPSCSGLGNCMKKLVKLEGCEQKDIADDLEVWEATLQASPEAFQRMLGALEPRNRQPLELLASLKLAERSTLGAFLELFGSHTILNKAQQARFLLVCALVAVAAADPDARAESEMVFEAHQCLAIAKALLCSSFGQGTSQYKYLRHERECLTLFFKYVMKPYRTLSSSSINREDLAWTNAKQLLPQLENTAKKLAESSAVNLKALLC